MKRRRREAAKFKARDRVYYVDDPKWRGVIVRIEDLDGDGNLTVVVRWDTDSETDGIDFEDIEHVPIVERLAELA